MQRNYILVIAVCKDFKQIVVREEVETWKDSSFDFHIVFKFLLDVLEVSVVLYKLLYDVFNLDKLKAVRIWGLHSFTHDMCCEELVDCIEHGGLLCEVLLDILSLEDVFKVAPLSLAVNPLSDTFLEHIQRLFKIFSPLAHYLNEAVAENHIDLRQTLVKSLVESVNFNKYELVVSFFVVFANELLVAPYRVEIVESSSKFGLAGGFN